jgi:hypothetical protein
MLRYAALLALLLGVLVHLAGCEVCEGPPDVFVLRFTGAPFEPSQTSCGELSVWFRESNVDRRGDELEPDLRFDACTGLVADAPEFSPDRVERECQQGTCDYRLPLPYEYLYSRIDFLTVRLTGTPMDRTVTAPLRPVAKDIQGVDCSRRERFIYRATVALGGGAGR